MSSKSELHDPDNLSRRTFLVEVGCAAAVTFLAGCGGGRAGMQSGGTTPAPTSAPTTAPTRAPVVDPAPYKDPWLIPPNSLFHFITTGQSLSTGTQGVPALSTVEPFSNLMFTFPDSEDSDFLNDPLSFNAVTRGFTDIAFRSLVGGPSVSGEFATYETIANGFADSLTARVPLYTQLMSCSGVGGVPYAGLAGPTDYPPSGSPPFEEMMSQVKTGMALATAAGRSYSVAAMLVIHGEFDNYNNAYADNLNTWQADTQTGVNAITGSSRQLPMIVAQSQVAPGAEGNYNTMPFHPNAGSLGTLAAAMANPTLIVLACPEYMMTHHYYEDAEGNPDPLGQPIHMTADGYRHLGLMMAKAAFVVCLEKGAWLPLMPTSVVLRGSAITIDYSVPSGPLVIDTSYVTDPGNYGFNYEDTNGTTIISVAVTGAAQIVVSVSSADTIGGWLSYALVDPGPASGAPYGQGFGPTRGPRGCVRDSDTTISYYNNSITGEPYPMQNYSVMWQQMIVQGG